jgi:hypothetical protein
MGLHLLPNVQRIAEFYVDAATALIIKHDDGRRPVDGDFRNVPTVAFDAAGRQPPACMGVRGLGADHP